MHQQLPVVATPACGLQPRSLTAAKLGVGACLWDGALVLTAYLMQQPVDSYRGRFICMSAWQLFPVIGSCAKFCTCRLYLHAVSESHAGVPASSCRLLGTVCLSSQSYSSDDSDRPVPCQGCWTQSQSNIAVLHPHATYKSDACA